MGYVFSCLDGKVGFGTLFILNINIPEGICVSSLMNSQLFNCIIKRFTFPVLLPPLELVIWWPLENQRKLGWILGSLQSLAADCHFLFKLL